MTPTAPELPADAIAVVGMALRLPDARTPDEFWANLVAGHHSVRALDPAALDAAGVPEARRRQPGFVAAGPILEDIDRFDADFFGISPREAELLDPQHRLLLEVAWAALEDAGIAPGRASGRVGVFAARGVGGYLMLNVLGHPELIASVGLRAIRHANRVDHLATRVAYHLGLDGAALTVQSGCSSGLLAVHLACQNLLGRECDVVLAGASSINVAQGRGYVHTRDGVSSPDGYCRAFDASAAGTVFGSGVAVVTLMRAEDAVAAGHPIRALLLGSAVNNDGARRSSYASHSVDGQTAVIAEAMEVADVHPEQLGLVEAQGTGTPLGDPLEVAALTRAFRRQTDRIGYCALGSVKTNIGHLDTAAGIAGLCKAILALQHGQIPASLHFRSPNPRLELERSPFFVPTHAIPFDGPPHVRRAGVTSFGTGGTNVHVVLGGWAQPDPAGPMEQEQEQEQEHVLPVAARSEAALERICTQIGERLMREPTLSLGDVARTLGEGRRAFVHRRTVVARRTDEAAQAFLGRAPSRVQGRSAATGGPVVFLFPGRGSPVAGVGRQLEQSLGSSARSAIDRWLEMIGDAEHGETVAAGGRALLFASGPEGDPAVTPTHDTAAAQAARFIIHSVLAQRLEDVGLTPEAMLGHGVGEVSAAHCSGVLDDRAAATLIVARGRALEATPPGAMLVLRVPGRDVESWLTDGIVLAAHDSPLDYVLAGSVAAIDACRDRAQREGVEHHYDRCAPTLHGPGAESAMARFAEALESIEFASPRHRTISNVTGDWIDPQRVVSPTYWVEQLRSTVRFGPGVATVLESLEQPMFVELGPGHALGELVRRGARADTPPGPLPRIVGALGPSWAAVLGSLWLEGQPIDFGRHYAGGSYRLVSLPTYAFDPQRHWIDPAPDSPWLGGSASMTTSEVRPSGRTGPSDEESST
ncbi:MAG: type I polyketide synthase [Myxococcota bacterium]